MSLAFHQVDAFSDRPFAGNPAMVYRLEQWLDEALMQRIAAEQQVERWLVGVDGCENGPRGPARGLR